MWFGGGEGACRVNTMKITILDSIHLDPINRKKLEQFDEIEIFDDIINEPQILKERIKDAEIITVNYVDLTAEIIRSARQCSHNSSHCFQYKRSQNSFRRRVAGSD